MTSNETLNCVALAMMFANRSRQLLELYQRVGSATAIVENASDLQAIAPDLNPQAFLIDEGNLKSFLDRATREMEFAEKYGVDILTPDNCAYPKQLLEVCVDAPLALYHKGNTNLNPNHSLAIVGTRASTEYGRDMVEAIISELARYFPDLLIVSGLAYGIDINAHRAALENNLPTVALLAHGHDRIYPSTHRNTAERMMQNGGLLTEFPSFTKMEPIYFLQRNRLIAGIAEATLVVESKERGGALTTARYANEYSLTVMACPGRANDPSSIGCNRLIATNRAALVSSAADIVSTLGWEIPKEKLQTQPTLFDDDFTTEERMVYNALRTEPTHLSTLLTSTGMSAPTVMSTLSELEFRGLVRQLPGTQWRKLK
ncbi:MAG: DNA-processing protein DprA [Bacteroidaceae bacterium]|nr:DNA-processing protein DprA [Bacteroidaceae bacterium]